MTQRVRELCRKLKPVLGRKVDRLWTAYLSESETNGRADIEQTLELLAAKHLGDNFQPDRSPFPPPDKTFAGGGDLQLGQVAYGGRELYPFKLKSNRLKEHILVAGRSGSGKTNLTFVLTDALMARGINVLALDWKRGYRDLASRHKNLRVYTIGRNICPFRFNPLIPPSGCEPGIWIKLIVDVIAGAYLGGEGVISLLIAGLDHLYRQCGVFEQQQIHWPTIEELLTWLRSVKLKGRAAMWQASAERILLAMCYGQFGKVLNTQDNSHIAQLLNHNVVLEMDGLSSNSDRTLFSEALTLYLYRYRLAKGPQEKLTNMIILEEAHNLLLKKSSESRESVLETSIRMVRQYGLGYVFVDQSASLLSHVAFANSYATLALSQKLRSDIQAISGAMNLTEEQRDALSTLPIGTAVVRLADQHPEAFLLKIPRCAIQEGSVSDIMIKQRMAAYTTDSRPNKALVGLSVAVPAVSPPDKTSKLTHIDKGNNTHPPSPGDESDQSQNKGLTDPSLIKENNLSREAVRFLADIAVRPLSTTVTRYLRLNLSRRRGNAIRQSLATAGIIEAKSLATRSGQVVLYQLTDTGRSLCQSVGIEARPKSVESLEHRYWTCKVAEHFEAQGYEMTREHPIKGNGAVDLLAQRGNEKVVIEIETGKSDIKANIKNMQQDGFDRMIVVATSPVAVGACQKAIAAVKSSEAKIELMTWLDIS